MRRPAPGCSMVDYIERGLIRNRSVSLPQAGDVRTDLDGRTAQFSVRLVDGVVDAVAFRVSPCITLVAYCELLAQTVTGRPYPEALERSRPTELVEALPGIPPQKRRIAQLAVAAMRSALARTAQQGEP